MSRKGQLGVWNRWNFEAFIRGGNRDNWNSRLAALAVVLTISLSIGCAPKEEMIRLESEVDRLTEEMDQMRLSTKRTSDTSVRSSRLTEEKILSLQGDLAAQKVNQDESARQIDTLAQRVEDMESFLSVLDQKIDFLSQSMQRLETPAVSGEVESSTSSPTQTETSPITVSSPEELYRTALADYRRGNYELAIIGFKAFLEDFPDGSTAGDANYFLGECLYASGDYEQAIKAYDKVILNFPQNSHVRSAYLKKGYAYIESNQLALGVVQLYHVIDNFPGTSEANLAQQRLQKMGLRRP